MWYVTATKSSSPQQYLWFDQAREPTVAGHGMGPSNESMQNVAECRVARLALDSICPKPLGYLSKFT